MDGIENNTEIEKLKQALLFYALEAQAIANHYGTNDEAVIASIMVLKIDAGKKAFNVLKGL